MSNRNDIFDDLIKSQLNGFDANVSMADWDAIESKLNVVQRKKVAAYWWILGVIVLVSGVLGLATWLNNSKDALNTLPEVVLNDGNTKSHDKSSLTSGDEETTNETTSPKEFYVENTNATSSEAAIKTSSQSTTEADRLPTNNVDTKADETHSKGVDDSAFSTESTDNSSSDEVDPSAYTDAKTIQIAKNEQAGNNEVTPIPNTITPKWELGASASLTWANKLINPNGENAWRINKDFDHIAKTMESGAVSYQIEGHFNKYLSEHLYLVAGLSYNQIVETASYDYVVDSIATERIVFRDIKYFPVDPRIGPIEVKYSGRNTYHYAELPVRIGYLQPIRGTNMNLRLETGLRTMYLISMSGKKADVTRVDSLIDLNAALQDYSRLNLGLSTNASVFWTLSGGKTDLGITFASNRSFTSIRKRDEAITEKPYNFGLNFSLQHKILIK